MPEAPREIMGMMATAIKEVLEDWCKNHVPEGDPSRVRQVVLGKPTRELKDDIVLSVLMNHPLGLDAGGDEAADGPPRKQDERPWKWPMETCGGMTTEKVVGAVQINYRRRKGYEDAIKEIGPIISRIKRGINHDARLANLKDDMGSFMSSIQAIRTEGYTSGSDEITIDRQWVTFRAWVHMSNQRVTLVPEVG